MYYALMEFAALASSAMHDCNIAFYHLLGAMARSLASDRALCARSNVQASPTCQWLLLDPEARRGESSETPMAVSGHFQ